MDIVGPFPKAVGNKKYLLIDIDYFTKWVEAEPLANIRDVDAKKFVWGTLSPDSGSLIPLSRTMAFSLTATPLGYIVVNWELRIDTLPQPILKETDKPRLLIRSSLMELRKGWMLRKENGWKNCHMSCEHIGPHLVDQQGKPLFQLLMELKSLFL